MHEVIHSTSHPQLFLPDMPNNSNSPFWYCDAGMNYVVGTDWRDQWDVVITSAGKPAFYTEDNRPFREVDIGTGKLKFRQVSASVRYFNTVSLQNMYIISKQTSSCFLPGLSRSCNWKKGVYILLDA